MKKSKIIFESKKNSFVKDNLIIGLGKYLIAICVLVYFNMNLRNNFSYKIAFVSLAIIIIPIYQIIFQRRDEVYTIQAIDDGVLIKWTKWWYSRSVVLNADNYIGSNIEPYLKRCLRFSIRFTTESGISRINQLCSKSWTEDKMKEIKSCLDAL
jgi:hypothetical protein